MVGMKGTTICSESNATLPYAFSSSTDTEDQTNGLQGGVAVRKDTNYIVIPNNMFVHEY